jgi:hypothetical protein
MMVFAFGMSIVLDDGRGDEHVVAMAMKSSIVFFELLFAHLAVTYGQLGLGHETCDQVGNGRDRPTRLWTVDLALALEPWRSAWRITSESNLTTWVWIDRRSSGGVSMMDMSRMPASDMFSVRGIGVAVIVRTSTRLRSC